MSLGVSRHHLYAQDLANKGQRGFVLSRTGSSYQNPDEVYPAGPWSGYTSTLAFTGDTWGTWNTLAFEAQLSADEASIDQPYVSDDIGSFLGPMPGNPQDDSDLYARWVQRGAFQPVDRLHSSAGNRLPWEYPAPAGSVAADFLRLREALIPYTYTLADESVNTGLPITQPLYLDYPAQPDAYNHPAEYLYGPSVLVAPVTTPGNVAKQTVRFPPGTWTDWFPGATFDGPSTQTLTVPLDRMPVFVKAGGGLDLAAGATPRAGVLGSAGYPVDFWLSVKFSSYTIKTLRENENFTVNRVEPAVRWTAAAAVAGGALRRAGRQWPASRLACIVAGGTRAREASGPGKPAASGKHRRQPSRPDASRLTSPHPKARPTPPQIWHAPKGDISCRSGKTTRRVTFHVGKIRYLHGK
jgi:hypothetical protein